VGYRSRKGEGEKERLREQCQLTSSCNDSAFFLSHEQRRGLLIKKNNQRKEKRTIKSLARGRESDRPREERERVIGIGGSFSRLYIKIF
jgi:hypothetical protein